MYRGTYSRLLLERLGRHKWQLLQDFQTPCGIAPRGFVTDGASVPRALWWLMSPTGELFEAAIIHDYLLSIESLDDSVAHKAFKRAALDYGVPYWKVQIAYIAVCVYGRIKKLFKKGKK